jgi:hypothetical protein
MDYMAKLKAVLTPEQMRFFELLGPPSLVAGENAGRYCDFVAAIFQSVQPKDIQDFIYQRDLVDLEWDVLRYRSTKGQLITNAKNRFDAIDLTDPAANDDAALTARVMGPMIPKLRQLDLMIESAEIRRDRAYRELERRRANLAQQLRDAVKQQTEKVVANDETAQRAA